MALNATMYRFSIDLTDLDRGVYENLSVHVALHPSETMERMATRLMAYCLNYSEALQFTKGLSDESVPDLWQKSYSDEIEHWIEMGLPDSKRIKKACSLSQRMSVYAYGGNAFDTWLTEAKKMQLKHSKLQLFSIDQVGIESFSGKIDRTMSLSCLIQDSSINLSWGEQMLEIPVTQL